MRTLALCIILFSATPASAAETTETQCWIALMNFTTVEIYGEFVFRDGTTRLTAVQANTPFFLRIEQERCHVANTIIVYVAGEVARIVTLKKKLVPHWAWDVMVTEDGVFEFLSSYKGSKD